MCWGEIRVSLVAMIPILLLSFSAYASDKTADDFSVSATLSPIHLLMPMVELTGEYQAAPKVGVAGILGVGAPSGMTAIEVGAQVRTYLLGDFKGGLELGAEMVYMLVLGSTAGVSATGNGLSTGPFVGGKYIFDVGFTLDAQLGVASTLVTASASDGDQRESTFESGFGPLLNINLGWSF